MFNATDLRNRAKKPTRLDSYLKSSGFNAILTGLVQDGVGENDIMRTRLGPGGGTHLHDAFFLDFMAWVGGESYYKATRRFMIYPQLKEQK